MKTIERTLALRNLVLTYQQLRSWDIKAGLRGAMWEQEVRPVLKNSNDSFSNGQTPIRVEKDLDSHK